MAKPKNVETPRASVLDPSIAVERRVETVALLDGNNEPYNVPLHTVGDAWEQDIAAMGLEEGGPSVERERLAVAVALLPDGRMLRLVLP